MRRGLQIVIGTAVIMLGSHILIRWLRYTHELGRLTAGLGEEYHLTPEDIADTDGTPIPD